MDRRRELKQVYKQTSTQGGVYQVRNTVNNKVLIVSTSNFRTINGRKMMLENGMFPNKALQQDYNQLGRDAFTFEVLETLDRQSMGDFTDPVDALKKMEQKWLQALRPYDERGYNRVSEHHPKR